MQVKACQSKNDYNIAIASYNNAKDLLLTLNTIKKTMRNFKNYNCEIIVVDDHSTDNTEDKLKNIKK